MLFLLLALGCLAVQGAFPGEADRITSLPGLPSQMASEFNLYSGYLTTDTTTGKNLFYYFVEKANNPENYPLVRFMNGGPGCSSLGGGGFEECGPFIPDSDGNLQYNNYTWARAANMLFIETPVGVGFSFSKTLSDYSSNDASTAKDNYDAMLTFLDKFPQYKGHDFYLTGESYFGHYGCGLTSLILDNPLPLNFKGIALGNPTTHIIDDFLFGTWKTWYARGLISQPTWEAIHGNCNSANLTFLNPPPNCQAALNVAQQEMGDKFNPYDLNVNVCPKEEEMLMRKLIARQMSFPPPLPYQPCEDGFISTYLNRPDVQAAMHVIPDTTQNGWSDCSSDTRFKYDYDDFYISQIPVYQRMIETTNLTVIVYSGIADTVVPYLGTQKWIWELFNSTTPTEKWHDWSTSEYPDQAAGFTFKFDYNRASFRFISIRGAGHLVPQTSPIEAYSVLNYLLHDAAAK